MLRFCVRVACRAQGSLLCLHFPFCVMNCLLIHSYFLSFASGLLSVSTALGILTFVPLGELLRQQKPMGALDDFPERGIAEYLYRHTWCFIEMSVEL